MLQLEIWQPFNFHDPAIEDVFFVGLFHGEQAPLDRDPGDCIHHIAECDPRLKRTAEPDQDRFGHVERHGTDGGSKGHNPGASWKRNTQREAGVAVTPCAHGVGQEHAIEPAVDDAVTGEKGYTAALGKEIR